VTLSLEARRQTAIAEFVRRLRVALGPHVVDLRLFGSVARRDAQPDSDIDILVIVQPEGDRARLERDAVDIAFDVNVQYDLYISPRVLPSSLLAHPVWGHTPFLRTIQRESVAL
jgi:uncharacterized protein